MQNRLLNRNIWIRIMKRSGLQLLFALTLVNISLAFDGNSQELLNRRVTLNAQNQDVELVIKRLEELSRVQFLFSREVIQSKRKISYQAKNEQLHQVLDHILTPLNLSYEVVGQQIVIKRNAAQSANLPSGSSSEASSADAKQDVQISGRVTDEKGEGLPGVNIQIKATTRGTITDADGNYRLSVPNAGAVLVFSLVGYVAQEATVSTQQVININLVPDNKTLDEVVVVGYGVQRKRDVTGSVVSVNEATLKEVPAPNLVNQLKGRAAGVTIVSNGSTPGSQGQIRIRGNRTLTTGNGDGLDGPLVVVDGIPYGGLNDINPDDIANLEILKDASATAIYGSRGAGGVILITTKRGKVGKPVFTYDGYHGLTNIMGKYNVMNGAEYAQFKQEAAKYNRTAPGTTAYPLTIKEQEALAAGISTNWQDLIYRQGFNTNHQLGLQGGTENTQYSLGLGYFNETGIIPSQKFERYTIRATIDQRLGKNIKIGLNTLNTLTYTNTPGGGGIPGGLVRLTPLAAPYNAEGSVNLFPLEGSIDAASVSPLTIITKRDSYLGRTRSLRTFNSLYAEVNILPGLRYRFNAGLNFSQSNYNGYNGPLTYFNNATVQSSSNAEISNTEFWDINLQHLLYYDKTFGKHKLGFTGLYEVTQNHSLGSRFTITGVPADYIKTSNFSLASGTPVASSDFGNSFVETGLLSYMGRVNYSYNDRYLLTLTLRRDGSSTLSPGNQYFNYPAIGAGWNIIEEGFMKGIPVISNLKLRGGWGISGNRNVGAYATLGALSAGYYNFGLGTAGQQLAYTVTSLPATNLGWQSTSQVDIGVDFGFLNNRITGTVDWYLQKTKDILLSVPLPPSNGAGSTLRNLGRTEGRGLETSLTFDIFRKPGGFNWSADLIYFFNREKITQLTTPTELSNVGAGWFVGQPLSVIYDYKKIGIWQTADQENGTLQRQTAPVQFPGQIRVEDVNGDNKIDPADRQILGNFQPKWEGGLTNRFTFKDFDLSIVTFARMGMKVVVPYLTGNSTGSGGFAFFNQGRVNQVKTDYWTETNPTNAFPAPDAGGAVQWFGSTLGYYDGSFVKIRSINLGYTFSNQLIKKIGMSSARLYFNATNPLILYSPLVRDNLVVDPEGNSYASGSSTLNPSNASERGTPERQIAVNLNNPPVRQFTLGVNLKF
ncbi:SusC/RagA family TonB-linked outer membrane protein [Fibrisoma montanum]|uniref:SusC/RagA family TonB-linked outer membrane protein n=1 Tax=Fibrisoma montanum TaxID=2305895 RepID=A0A418M152_9BACT|nr:TonB-dependent receptor [Fibrisoma montanum]RIV19428.1 SusC/RagA family TonB-linked outer membrane protein [Fibrisoma montanum]